VHTSSSVHCWQKLTLLLHHRSKHESTTLPMQRSFSTYSCASRAYPVHTKLGDSRFYLPGRDCHDRLITRNCPSGTLSIIYRRSYIAMRGAVARPLCSSCSLAPLSCPPAQVARAGSAMDGAGSFPSFTELLGREISEPAYLR
jgi:hypothetical protein